MKMCRFPYFPKVHVLAAKGIIAARIVKKKPVQSLGSQHNGIGCILPRNLADAGLTAVCAYHVLQCIPKIIIPYFSHQNHVRSQTFETQTCVGNSSSGAHHGFSHLKQLPRLKQFRELLLPAVLENRRNVQGNMPGHCYLFFSFFHLTSPFRTQS